MLGPSHVGRGTRAVRGDVGLRLLHDAPCALAVAPAGYGARPVGPPAVVGVAWDDTEEAAQALAAAADIAHRAHARLRLIHVLPSLPPTVQTASTSEDSHHDAQRTTAERRLEEAAAQLGVQRPETLILGGDVAHELARAGAEVDVLLAGSRANGPLRRMLVGSVTSRLLHDAPCPVVILPRGAGVAAAAEA